MAASPTVRASLVFVAIAAAALLIADVEVSTLDPWGEMGRMGLGLISPDFRATGRLGAALLQTVAFAILGVALAAVIGFGLALLYRFGPVRWGAAFVRAVHELFWALIFLQIFGLSPLTGLLAIAIPYGGIFAKLYAEILDEADPRPAAALPDGAGMLSAFFFTRLPDVWVHMKTYTAYRLECGLRSSAILGFVGLPTLGFHLESAFKQGHYSEVSALLILFFVLIATMRFWVRPKLVWIYLLIAPFLLEGETAFSAANLVRFLTVDIVPHPLRVAETLDMAAWSAFGDWAWMLFAEQALPGIGATVILTQIALIGTGLLTLVLFPLVSRQFFRRPAATAGHVLLVIARSTPEYILAYIFLQFWGPSMLPGIAALTIHNGAIIGHLIGRYADTLRLRPDAPTGLNRYFYEVVPRIYGQFLSFLFYRWEVIMRETAILGILGLATLGFYIDSAFQDLRFDRAMALILITALLNICVDIVSRRVRASLRLTMTPDET